MTTRSSRDARAGRRWLIVCTAFVIASVPASLAIETGVRLALAPPIFERMRMYLRPTMTPVAWWSLLVVALASALGVWLAARLVRRDLDARARSRGPVPGATLMATCPESMRVVINRLAILSAVPQVPGVIATLLFMFGSELTPVLVALAISSAGVCGQAAVASALHRAHVRTALAREPEAARAGASGPGAPSSDAGLPTTRSAPVAD